MKLSMEDIQFSRPLRVLDWKVFSKIPYRPLEGLDRPMAPGAQERVMQSLPEALRALCGSMAQTCLKEGGIGLAAPQIGTNIAIVALVENEGKGPFEFLFNPEWKPLEGHKEKGPGLEACLSVTGKYLNVERFLRIEALWYSYEDGGFTLRREILEGQRARVYQHEVDHLFGRSIVDRVSKQNDPSGSVLGKRRK